MKIIDTIRAFFSKKKTEETPVLIDITPTVTMPSAESILFEAPLASPPYWLENEDALRDEGVIFGLTDVNPSEKISVIKLFFAQQTADISKQIEQFSEKMQEFNLFLGQKEEKIASLKSKKENLEAKEINTEHQLLRTTVGLLLAIVICVGNYFLIETSLRPSFADSAYIAIGVFMAGMFNLFSRTSMLHETSEFSWRRGLEEIGMPLAAAVFVFAQVADTQPIGKALALLFFVFFLFLFTGKLFLSNLTLLKSDFEIWSSKKTLAKDKIEKVELWETEISEINKEIDALRVERWKILPDLNKLEAEMARMDAQRDMLIKVFESEYNLAKSFRSQLNAKQMKDILGD